MSEPTEAEMEEFKRGLEEAGFRVLTDEEEAEMGLGGLQEEIRSLDGTWSHAHVNIVGRGQVPLEVWTSHGGERYAMAAVLKWEDMSLVEQFEALSHEIRWSRIRHILADEFPEMDNPNAWV